MSDNLKTWPERVYAEAKHSVGGGDYDTYKNIPPYEENVIAEFWGEKEIPENFAYETVEYIRSDIAKERELAAFNRGLLAFSATEWPNY